MSFKSSPIYLFLGGIVCSVVYSVYVQFLEVEPYMDEIFHIPQAQRYCQGKYFAWDPKITTFPGLYLFSSIPTLIAGCSDHDEKDKTGTETGTETGTGAELEPCPCCSTAFLRGTVLLLAAAIPFVAARCRQSLFPTSEDGAMVGALVFIFPLSFFYYFLYYTDTLSTLALLLCYWLSAATLKHHHRTTGTHAEAGTEVGGGVRVEGFPTSSLSLSVLVSGLLSFLSQLLLLASASLAIMARQTNAVWILFIAGTSMLHLLQEEKQFRDVPLSELSIQTLGSFLLALIRNLPPLLRSTWPLLIPVLAFVIFVVGFNEGGIVVGDKDNHRMVLHAAMPLHLLLAVSLLLGPRALLLSARELAEETTSALLSRLSIKQKSKRVFCLSLLFCGVSGVIYLGCLSHPFLEADNRHLSFYVWRYLLSKPLRRIILGPVYTICLLIVVKRLSHYRRSLWLLIYLVAVCVTLLPAHLFEFRYFTPGAVIALVNMPPVTKTCFAWSFSTNASISLVLLYIFLEKSFTWPDDSIARFML